MPKRVIQIGEMSVKSLTAMVNTLGKMIGDEVYIWPSVEIESSEPVLKALDAVLEGAKKKAGKGEPA